MGAYVGRPIRGRSRLCLFFLPSQFFMLQHRNADKKKEKGKKMKAIRGGMETEEERNN